MHETLLLCKDKSTKVNYTQEAMRKVKQNQMNRRFQYYIWVAMNAEEVELKNVLKQNDPSQAQQFDPKEFFKQEMNDEWKAFLEKRNNII